MDEKSGLEQLTDRLKSTGLPVTYLEWEPNKAPPLPWLAYVVGDSESMFADGGVYYQFDRVEVELYTKFKDAKTEKRVEAALTAYHWKKSQDYLRTERCYITVYEIEV